MERNIYFMRDLINVNYGHYLKYVTVSEVAEHLDEILYPENKEEEILLYGEEN